MNRQKITDERVVRLNQKVQSEGFQAALLLAAASATVKTYVFDMGPRDIAAELIIILGSLCYVAVRSTLLGHGFMDSSRWGKVLTAAAVVGLSLAVCVSSGIRNYAQYGQRYDSVLDGAFLAVLAVSFFSSIISLSAVLALLHGLSRAGQRRLERKLEETDRDTEPDGRQ